MKRLVATATAFLLVMSGITACSNDEGVDEGATVAPPDQHSIQKEEEQFSDAPTIAPEDETSTEVEGGTFDVEVDQAVIDQRIASGEPLVISNPDQLDFIFYVYVEDGIFIVSAVVNRDSARGAEAIAVTSSGQSLLMEDLTPWATPNQMKKLECLYDAQPPEMGMLFLVTGAAPGAPTLTFTEPERAMVVEAGSGCNLTLASERDTGSSVFFINPRGQQEP